MARRVTETAVATTGTVPTRVVKQPGKIARIYDATVGSSTDVIEDTMVSIAHGTSLLRGTMATMAIESKTELNNAKVDFAKSYVANKAELAEIGMSFDDINELLSVRY